MIVFIISLFFIFVDLFLYQQLFLPLNSKFNFDDNALYIYNHQLKDKYVTKEMENNACYYYFDYIEEDSIKTVLYTNENGLKHGLPYFGQLKTCINLNENIEYNKLLENKNGNICEGIKIKNLVYNVDYNIDYIYVTNDIEVSLTDIIVYPYLSMEIKNNSNMDIIGNDSIYSLGYHLNHFVDFVNDLQVKLLLILSIIPVIAMILTISNLIDYILKKRKDNILINYIYYKESKSIKLQIILQLILIVGSCSLLSNVIIYLTLGLKNINMLYIPTLIIVILNLIYLLFKVEEEVNKIISYNNWRYYND